MTVPLLSSLTGATLPKYEGAALLYSQRER
jgi:hypothetical protein